MTITFQQVPKLTRERPAQYVAGDEAAYLTKVCGESGELLVVVDSRTFVHTKPMGTVSHSVRLGKDSWGSRKKIWGDLKDKYGALEEIFLDHEIIFNEDLQIIGARAQRMMNMQRWYSREQLNKYLLTPLQARGVENTFSGEIWSPEQMVANVIVVCEQEKFPHILFYPGDSPPVYVSEYSLPTIAAAIVPCITTLKAVDPEYLLAEFWLGIRQVSPQIYQWLAEIEVKAHHLEKIMDFARRATG